MKEQNNRAIGKQWEEKVLKYLEKNGYELVENNFTIRGGEIDIITKKDGCTVFFEVKYRSTSLFGDARETLTWSKKKTLLRSIKYYCLKQGISEENIQVDFIAISKERESYKLYHYKNIEI